MTTFKKGDKFIPYKPINDARWTKGMDKYEGHTFTVCDIIDCTDGLAITALGNNRMFLADWCEKVEEIPNNHIPDVGRTIDWEQRRYELAKSAMQGLIATGWNIYEVPNLVGKSIEIADEMIKQLKQQ